jgi:ATP-dependent Zn protease
MRTKTASLRATAYHEAGHAVMAWILGVKIRSATIAPEREAGIAGSVSHEKVLIGKFPEAIDSDRQRIRAEKLIMVSLAGPIAQVLYNPRSFRRYHAGFDWDRALDLSTMCTESISTTERHIEYLEARTKDHLRNPEKWKLVKKLADELLATRTVDGVRIAELCVEPV